MSDLLATIEHKLSVLASLRLKPCQVCSGTGVDDPDLFPWDELESPIRDLREVVKALREVRADNERLIAERAPVREQLPIFSLLSAFASTLPCRTIHGEQGPYLSRYTLRELDGGGHVYLHFFHRGDADGELHNHPWAGMSIILAGGYREERRVEASESYTVSEQTYRPGDFNLINADTFHRVDLLDPAGCWTLFITGEKVQSWGFWHRDTGAFTPWRTALTKRGLLEPGEVARDS